MLPDIFTTIASRPTSPVNFFSEFSTFYSDCRRGIPHITGVLLQKQWHREDGSSVHSGARITLPLS